MSLAIEFQEEARDEYREAALRYEAEREGLGVEFMDAVESALERVARGELPTLSNPEGGPSVRRLVLRRFPFTLHIEVWQGKLMVWAVAHQKRRPGYWSDRR